MAATKTLTGKVSQIQRDIQTYLALFYEIASIAINQAGEVSAILTLSDTPGSVVKTVKVFKGKKTYVEATIQSYNALGYELIKHQEVRGEFYSVMLLNGSPKVYKALLTQLDINAPIHNVLKNTLNVDAVNSYVEAGLFIVDFDIDYDQDKIYQDEGFRDFLDQNNSGVSFVHSNNAGKLRWTIVSFDGGIPANSIMVREPFSFEVYP